MSRYAPIFLVVILLSLLSFPPSIADRLRSVAVATLAPAWQPLANIHVGAPRTPQTTQEEIAALQLENHQLRELVALFKSQIELAKWMSEGVDLLRKYDPDHEFSVRRREELERLIPNYLPAVMGRVIFRESLSWTSTFWINVGKDQKVEKQSPVVLGNRLVGVIDYVGSHRSRVRLITDGSVTPSVRAFREGEKLPLLLAKGEVCGVRASRLRSRAPILKGMGFNYDFEDEEGNGANLVPIVQKGDLLVTTGMDGVFPAGLKVGQVIHVYPLQEGACAYEVDAEALAGDFNEMTFVTVLPPLHQDDFLIDSSAS